MFYWRVFQIKYKINHINPRSASEIVSPSPTIIWSKQRTSISCKAALNCCVIEQSDELGSAMPEGWLWDKMTAAALYFNAASAKINVPKKC